MSAPSLLSEREYPDIEAEARATLRVPFLLFATMVNGNIVGAEISGSLAESHESYPVLE